MPRSFVIGAVLAISSVACADLYRLGDYSVGADAPAAESPSSPGAPASAPAATGTKDDPIVINASGASAPLVTAECPRVLGDASQPGAVIIGTILDAPLERAAVLAAKELGAPLVVVSCDPGAPLVAAHHLVDDLHAAAIIGPGSAEDVIDVTQAVSAKAGTLLITPTAQATGLSNLADADLTWRLPPSDAQRANLVIAQMNALEDVLKSTRGLTAVKLGIVHRTDMLGASARDAISGKLVLNGRFMSDAANAQYVSIDAYTNAASATDPLAAIVTRYAGTFRPDMVFITAPEQIDGVVVPLEKALVAARVVNKPYYVIAESAKTPALLDAITAAGMPTDLKRRIRGIAATSDAESAIVRASFEERLGAKASFAEAASYDAMYAVGLAIAGDASASAKTPDGTRVAKGLRRLGVGASMSVGPSDAAQVKSALASGKSVSLRGASALLEWDSAGDIAAGTVEVWCIGTGSGAPAFGASGVAMDVSTQVVAGTFVQCQ